MDINGHSIIGLTIAEVADIIRESPREFLTTVRPVASVHKALKQDFTRTNYTDIIHFKTDSNGLSNGGALDTPSNNGSNEEYQYAVINKKTGSKMNGHVNKVCIIERERQLREERRSQ